HHRSTGRAEPRQNGDSRGLGCCWAEVSSLLAAGCILDRDLHSFACQHRVGKSFLTQFFDAFKKLVVVFGIVMREGQALCAGHFRKLHGLIEAAVSPSAMSL